MKSINIHSVRDTAVRIIEIAFHYALDILAFVIRKAGEFASASWSWFLELPLIEKFIIFNGIPAIFAAILPIATFDIFDSVYQIQNPVAHIIVLIGLYMFGSIFFRHIKWFFYGRLAFNAYYLIRIIYLTFAAGEITKNPQYTLSSLYFLNFVVPVLYALFSFISWKSEN